MNLALCPRLALLVAPLLASAFAGCGGGRVIDDVGDGDANADGVRRVTLTCNFEYEEGLDFASGDVRRLPFSGSTDVEVDVRCTMSRLIALRAANVTDDCFADPVHSEAARFDTIDDVDGDCALAGVTCNYLTDPYEPACAGVGGVMPDRAGVRSYAIRVVSDDVVGRVGTFVVEYAPVE